MDKPKTLNLVVLYVLGIISLAFCVYLYNQKTKPIVKDNLNAITYMIILVGVFSFFSYRAYKFENPSKWFLTVNEASAHSVGELIRDRRGWFLKSLPGEPGYLLFGSYLRLRKGRYIAEYDIQGNGRWGAYDVHMIKNNSNQILI